MDKKTHDFNYIKVFGIAFLIFAVCIIPSLVLTKGIWIYYGDFNVQQIPFYMHVHEAVRHGNIFYDWGTDLGGSLVGMYSFYLLGSPFFWITLLFPTAAVPYLMPWVSALKYAVMALSAYTYMKKYVKKADFALMGALLYAFSGFQGAVLVYNHFHDVMAFFPLFLILFERLVEKKKPFAFAFMASFMLILNYYFFVGEAVFLVIYYFARYGLDREIKAKEKLCDLLRAFFAGLSGVLMAGVYILPAVYYTLGNKRLSQTLEGYSLVAYEEPTMLWGIIKNVVMLPDVSGLNSMLNANYSRVSGVGAYIPLFSIAGVVAYFLYKKGMNWQKRLLTFCVVFATVPFLNALFSAMNSEYYARWYYMPILIMAMISVSVLEEKDESLPYIKIGAHVTAVISVVISLMSILPAKKEDGEWTILGMLKNYEQLLSEIVFSLVMLFFLYIYIYTCTKKKDGVAKAFVVGACIATTATMLYTGTFLVDSDRKTDFISQAIQGESPLGEKNEYYRFETDEDFYNYPLIWEGSHCLTSFISTINNSTLDFYDAMAVPRKVTSNLWTSRLGMRAMLSSKYFISNNMHSIEFIGHIEDMEELKDYEKIGEKNGFNIYENSNFIPMGFTYEYAVVDAAVEEAGMSASAKDRLLVRAITISSEDAGKFQDCLEVKEPTYFQTTSLQVLEKESALRAESACTDFDISTYGFKATATLPKKNLVFFSVPYEDGFTAFVDGKRTDIIKANYGFMAVCVPEGTHNIEFKYVPSGADKGMKLTILGLSVLFLLLIKYVYNKEKENLQKTE